MTVEEEAYSLRLLSAWMCFNIIRVRNRWLSLIVLSTNVGRKTQNIPSNRTLNRAVSPRSDDELGKSGSPPSLASGKSTRMDPKDMEQLKEIHQDISLKLHEILKRKFWKLLLKKYFGQIKTLKQPIGCFECRCHLTRALYNNRFTIKLTIKWCTSPYSGPTFHRWYTYKEKMYVSHMPLI